MCIRDSGKHGFAVATGGEGTVGLAGATLGGGFGLLARHLPHLPQRAAARPPTPSTTLT